MTKPDQTTRHQPKPDPDTYSVESAILRAVGLNPYDVTAFTLTAQVGQPTTMTVDFVIANVDTLEPITTRYTLTEDTP